MEKTNCFQNDLTDEQSDNDKIANIQKLYSIYLKLKNYIYPSQKLLNIFYKKLNELVYIFHNSEKNFTNFLQKYIYFYESLKKKIKNKIGHIEEFMKENNKISENLSNKIKNENSQFDYIDKKITPFFMKKLDILIDLCQIIDRIIQSNDVKMILDLSNKALSVDEETLIEINKNEKENQNEKESEYDYENINFNENEIEKENENNENEKESENLENENENQNIKNSHMNIFNKNENKETKDFDFLGKKRIEKKKKCKTINKNTLNSKLNAIDLISKLQKKYPTSSEYIKKLSKESILNQLKNTIIYECFIDYTENRMKKSIIRCIGNKKFYKFLKLEFEINERSKQKVIINNFKDIFTDGYFYLRKKKNKFELSGKIMNFSILLSNYCQNLSLINNLGIKTIRLFIYQFYEELAHEYQSQITNNVKIEMNDELINTLNNNYNMLILVRNYFLPNSS